MVVETKFRTEEIREVKYPDLDRLSSIYPSPTVLVGRTIIAQEKRDGSNVGLYLDENGDLQIRTREMIRADQSIYACFKDIMHASEQSSLYDTIRAILFHAADFGERYVIFGELLMKGKSPARFEIHDANDFVVFDIYEANERKDFMPYDVMKEVCDHWFLQTPKVYGTSTPADFKDLLKWKDEMFAISQEENREGVVFKTYATEQVPYTVMFKERKTKAPKPPKEKKLDAGPQLPDLDEGEVRGAVFKVLTDIGPDRFRDVKEAMPMVVKYINHEAEKHTCKPPRNPYDYYKERLEEMMRGL
jgi:hypothetical protein